MREAGAGCSAARRSARQGRTVRGAAREVAGVGLVDRPPPWRDRTPRRPGIRAARPLQTSVAAGVGAGGDERAVARGVEGAAHARGIGRAGRAGGAVTTGRARRGGGASATPLPSPSAKSRWCPVSPTTCRWVRILRPAGARGGRSTRIRRGRCRSCTHGSARRRAPPRRSGSKEAARPIRGGRRGSPNAVLRRLMVERGAEPRSLCSPPSTVLWPDPIAPTRSSSIRTLSSLPRPRYDGRGGLEPSQVPCMDVRACLGSQTPRSPHALTKADARCCLRPLIEPRHSESSCFDAQ